MARRVFFSFKYRQDVSRAMVVRHSWVTQGREAAGFIDAANFEKVKRQGDAAIPRWIDSQLQGTSVTVVLVGERTCNSRWVKYEISKSKEIGNGLLGIDISQIEDLQKKTTKRCGQIPKGYPFYLWRRSRGPAVPTDAKEDGYNNLGDWIDKAAKAAGR